MFEHHVGAKNRRSWEEINRDMLRLHEKGSNAEQESLNCDDILQRRARKLSKNDSTTLPEHLLDTLQFRVGYERYGLDLSNSNEVFPLCHLTQIPTLPSFIAGVINLRGKIISVVNLRTLFDLNGEGVSDQQSIVVIKNAHMEFALLVDEIIGVEPIDLDQLTSNLPTLTGIRADYLLGVTPDRIVILDALRLLTDPRMVIDQQS